MDIAITRRDPGELVRAAWARWKDPIWLGLTVIGLLAVPFIVWYNRDLQTILGFDAFATWSLNFKDLYGIQYMDLGAFRYSPAYAQAFFWAHLIPWELFAALFIGASFFILWRWAGRWTFALIALPPVALELYHGNIHLFMAAAMVVGFRYPSAWAFPLLAKVTPGIAVLWFAGARQWRNLAIALGTTAAITAVSFVIAPQQWIEFAKVNAAAFASFDCRAWRADLSNRADYVVVTPVVFGFFVVPPQQTFTSDPAVQLVFDQDGAKVFRLSGPLHPEAC